ncbi:MAG: 50S ribosomal protein L30 [Ammonifex sp.]|nr:MAG: 50S ribosomal protein L30 [Ammonifex sp.]
MAELKITLVRSISGATRRQRATVEALGLRRINHTVVQEDSQVIQGMLAKVRHLVRVEEGK